MINEKAEYDFYYSAAQSEDKAKEFMLRFFSKKDGLYLSRAIVIILRQSLFENGEPWDESGLPIKEKTEKAVKTVEEWLEGLLTKQCVRDELASEDRLSYTLIEKTFTIIGKKYGYDIGNKKSYFIFERAIKKAEQLGYTNGNKYYKYALNAINEVFSDFDITSVTNLTNNLKTLEKDMIKAIEGGPLRSCEGFLIKDDLWEKQGKLYCYFIVWYKFLLAENSQNRYIPFEKKDYITNSRSSYSEKYAKKTWKEILGENEDLYSIKELNTRTSISIPDKALKNILLVKKAEGVSAPEGWIFIKDNGVNDI